MANLGMMVHGMPPLHFYQPSTAFSNFALDASGDKVAWAFQAEEAATITHLGFRYGARTGTPPVYKISLQSLDASGNPDGTVLGGGSPASATFTPPADTTWDGTFQWVALSNSVAVSRGAFYAIVIEHSSGTVDASNFGSFTYQTGNGSNHPAANLFPHAQTNAGSWSKTFGLPVFGYKSASRSYGIPIETGIAQGLTQAGTPDEAGNKFTLPAGAGDTFQVIGVFGHLRLHATTGTVKINLYDSNGSSVLQSIEIDTGFAASTSDMTGGYLFDEATLSTLNYGSAYYLSVEATSAAQVTLYGITGDSSAENDALGLPGMFAAVTRADAGSWTEDAASRYMLFPIVSDITEPAGGSGVSRARVVNA